VAVLVGTASVVPELGYAVPPGQWVLEIGLATETGALRLVPLAMTVTP
jgi:hypothetical protein